jgi:hypothetical protein
LDSDKIRPDEQTGEVIVYMNNLPSFVLGSYSRSLSGFLSLLLSVAGFLASAPLADANHPPTGSVTISGTAKEGETLTASNDLADEDGKNSIDVLVVYPQPAEQQMQYMINWGRNWGETDLDSFLKTIFEQVTGIYRDSGVSVTFNVVHSEQVDFSHVDADWQVDLSSALMNSEGSSSYLKQYVDEIEALRSSHCADIVVYWRQFGDGGPGSNGAGSIGGGQDEAYIHLTYGGMNPAIVAHESGHLLSGEHGDGVQGSAFYAVNGDTPKLREYRTIMTTAVSLGLDQYNYLWRFSDADATVTGDVTCSELNGSPKTCSFEVETPLGSASNNVVSKLRSMVPVVSGFRMADGDLRYQWNRDGEAIVGATGTSYTLTQDDVGSMITVTASYTDFLGTDESVTSDPTGVVESSESPPAPEITEGPQGQTVHQGASLALSVAATSSVDHFEELGYQWRKDGVDLPGATGSTLALEAEDRSVSGAYSVVVSDSAGSLQSSDAVLRVLVSQRLEPLGKLDLGGFRLRFGDHDGYALQDADKDNFIVQWSTDLTQWMVLIGKGRSVVDGKVVLDDPAAGESVYRFYRVIEQ